MKSFLFQRKPCGTPLISSEYPDGSWLNHRTPQWLVNPRNSTEFQCVTSLLETCLGWTVPLIDPTLGPWGYLLQRVDVYTIYKYYTYLIKSTMTKTHHSVISFYIRLTLQSLDSGFISTFALFCINMTLRKLLTVYNFFDGN